MLLQMITNVSRLPKFYSRNYL